jgi:hypothetical protein
MGLLAIVYNKPADLLSLTLKTLCEKPETASKSNNNPM